jgi:hypothetical protein
LRSSKNVEEPASATDTDAPLIPVIKKAAGPGLLLVNSPLPEKPKPENEKSKVAAIAAIGAVTRIAAVSNAELTVRVN